MTRHYFITGTDTEIGKTYVTCEIARQLREQGQTVSCFKPVASGAAMLHGELVNDDAVKLQQAASTQLPMKQINPYCFEPAIAPHIAAQQAGVEIDLNVIQQCIASADTDVVLIEGFGGWLAPVSLAADNTLWQADIARSFNAEVVLVVGIRLGCLNHSMLSVKQIQQDGFILKGWIANQLDPDMPMLTQNIETLSQIISPPLFNFTFQTDA